MHRPLSQHRFFRAGWEPLYTKEECTAIPWGQTAWIKEYAIDKEAPIVIICPGGGYQKVADFIEGKPFAQALNRYGFHAFVLQYRVGAAALYPNPMEDLARALCIVKSRYGSRPVILWGSSAAGHLCAYFAASYHQFSNSYRGKTYMLRPDAVVLCYPVINLVSETHAGSRDTLLGCNADPDTLLRFSADALVTASYPPTFLWHCTDDQTVPVSNSSRFAQALKKAGVPHEFCCYPQGGHGIGLAAGTSAAGWFERAALFLKNNL